MNKINGTGRHLRTVSGIIVTLALVWSTGAFADDKYSVEVEQKLMLRIAISHTVGIGNVNRFYRGIGMGNFVVKDWRLSSQRIVQWCTSEVRKMQIKRNKVNLKGEARVDEAAYRERCSDIYGHRLKLTHSCEAKRKKKKTYVECKVAARMTVIKANAIIKNGQLVGFRRDNKFGKKGVYSVRQSNSSTSRAHRKTGGVQGATRRALRSAVNSTAMFTKRKLLDIKAFQLHAPIVGVHKGNALMCLSKKVLALDTPFHVIVNMGGKEIRKGWIKARRIYDGCADTTARGKKRRKLVLKPTEAEIIIGGSDVKRQMTAWEMPQIGLNIGVQAGLMPFIDFQHGFGITLMNEFNFGAKIGISELHAVLYLGLGFYADNKLVRESFQTAYDTQISGLEDLPKSSLVLQADTGVIKRWYMGRLMIDLGITIGVSYYMLDAFDAIDLDSGEEVEVMLGNIGVSVTPLIGFGFQIAPRWILRALAGFRMGITMPNLQIDEETEEPRGTLDFPMELGLTANVGLLYTF
jgi:hypothetical protein